MRVVFEMVDSVVKRFSSKIIKMDENNQYGFRTIEPYERSCSQIMSRAEIKKNKNKEDTLFSLPFNPFKNSFDFEGKNLCASIC